MDIKETIEKAVAAITGDKEKVAAFEKDPTSVVKGVLGGGAGDDLISKVVAAVKAKLSGGALSGIADKIGGLFGKK